MAQINRNNETDLTPQECWDINAESRINLVRAMGILTFYLIHLLNVSATYLGDGFRNFFGSDAVNQFPPSANLVIFMLCFGWIIQTILIHVLLLEKKPIGRIGIRMITVGDLFWLTALLACSVGPAGVMVVGYLLIIVMAGLRFDLRLIQLTTLLTIIAYVVLLGLVRWPFGLVKDLALESIPRYQQLMFGLALLFCGVLTGQLVRLGWRLVAMDRVHHSGISK
ncbi:MAG: hypothetical protein GY819_17940 [Planctomycetaceae bacterium]|nr:hypothetical protein [Planctomycetaceae bacterium]MDG1807332.1 hypothetical protein [Pirellulaceae bacterium]MDG2104626.1 hypothetical protein [Pirellulaceae bacterium]